MVTPKRLYKGQLSASAAILYTATSVIAVVREIVVVNDQIADRMLTFWLNGTTDADLWTPKDFVIPGNCVATWKGILVIPSGETFKGKADVADDLTVSIHGSETS